MADNDKPITQKRWTTDYNKPVPEFLKKEADQSKREETIAGMRRKEDKGNPRPNVDNFKSVTEYFKAEDKWKKDNPLAAKREAQQAKENVKKHKQRMINRDKFMSKKAPPKKHEYKYAPGEWEPDPRGEPIASGGQVKKYGYMGGGKVYAQPRKANYTAG